MITDAIVEKHERSEGLRHIQSQLCWCEPVLALDEDGKEILVHQEVTWN
jgi:hypothetical protein